MKKNIIIFCLNNADGWEMIEEIKRRQNHELLALLEDEQAKEDQREQMKSGLDDPVEIERLERIFGIERAKANEKIMEIVRGHETELQSMMQQIGLR